MNALSYILRSQVLDLLLKEDFYREVLDLLLSETDISYVANAPAYLALPGTYSVVWVDKVLEYPSEVQDVKDIIYLPRYLDYEYLGVLDNVFTLSEKSLILPSDYKVLYIK